MREAAALLIAELWKKAEDTGGEWVVLVCRFPREAKFIVGMQGSFDDHIDMLERYMKNGGVPVAFITVSLLMGTADGLASLVFRTKHIHGPRNQEWTEEYLEDIKFQCALALDMAGKIQVKPGSFLN